MEKVADITLIRNSTAGEPPKTFSAQPLRFHRPPDTVEESVDGIVSLGSHPTEIFWQGGKAEDLKGVTDVKVAAGDHVLVDGALTLTYNAPHDVPGGVEFEVLETRPRLLRAVI